MAFDQTAQDISSDGRVILQIIGSDGALGHLKAKEAKEAIYDCLGDSNLEVRKSALQAIIDLGYSLSEEKIKEISNEKDPEFERLLVNVKRNGGPKGI